MLDDMDAKTLLSSDSSPHWGFWGTMIWGLVLAVIYTILQTLFIGIYIGMTTGDMSTVETDEIFQSIQHNGFAVSISVLLSTIICCPLLIAIIKLKRGSSVKNYLGLYNATANQVIRWGGLAIALAVFSDVITILLGRPIVPEFVSAIYSSARYPLLLWLALVVAAPLFEEGLFRGFLLKGFSPSFLGPIGAVILTSILWAALHLQYGLYEIVTTLVFGCLLGAARLKTGSILLTIGIHAFLNMVATVETIILLASGST
jgi:membrane protease YdiL (CAAX protease family)